jgi:iron complex transport system permease protein
MSVSLLYSPDSLDLWAPLRNREGLEWRLLLSVRLPRVLLGAAVGISLGAAGAALQAMLRNPLADPYVLGLSGGAALGATTALVASAGLGALGVALGPISDVLPGVMSFIGAVVALVSIWNLAKVDGEVSPYTLLLAGTVFNAFTAAVVTFVQSVVTAEKSQEILFWLMGTLGGAPRWTSVWLASLAALIVLTGLSWLSPQMNLLSLGEETASYSGVEVKTVQRQIFLLVSLGVGLTVSSSGLIGFVGLIIPHMLRLMLGPDLRRLIILSGIGGGAFLVLCDLGTRITFSYLRTEPPVGVITAMFGGPFFLWLLRNKK